MGCLTSLGNNGFRIRYDLPLENGKRRQKKETLENTNRKAANAILAGREATVSKGLYFVDESTTFGRLLRNVHDEEAASAETARSDDAPGV
jgi:hypothetical protein